MIKGMKKQEIEYLFFTQPSCSMCKPIKAYINEHDLPVEEMDVTTETGMSEAAFRDIFETPALVNIKTAGVYRTPQSILRHLKRKDY